MLLSGWSLGEKGYCVVIHGSEFKIPVRRILFFGGPILLCWEMQRPIATETSISKLFDGQFGS